jgi:hypothetical protein
MSTTIPAEAAIQLRDALYMQLGSIAEDLATAPRSPRGDASQWLDAIARFDPVRAVLDAIGWDDDSADITLDLTAHRTAIIAALRAALESEHYLMDTPDEGQRGRATARAAVVEGLLSEVEAADIPTAEMTLTPEVAALVREQLHTTVADTIERRDELEGAWLLLDEMGWSDEDDPAPIDLVEHGDALLDAIDGIVPLLEQWLEEMDDDDSRRPERRTEIEALRQIKTELGG